MKRRLLYIVLFLAFSIGVVVYATTYVSTPKMTFNQAAKIDDAHKKVMIIGKVLGKEVTPGEEGGLSFSMVDSSGVESRVNFSDADDFTPGRLSQAAKSGSTVSIAGHSHGTYFHATSMFFPD